MGAVLLHLRAVAFKGAVRDGQKAEIADGSTVVQRPVVAEGRGIHPENGRILRPQKNAAAALRGGVAGIVRAGQRQRRSVFDRINSPPLRRGLAGNPFSRDRLLFAGSEHRSRVRHTDPAHDKHSRYGQRAEYVHDTAFLQNSPVPVNQIPYRSFRQHDSSPCFSELPKLCRPNSVHYQTE